MDEATRTDRPSVAAARAAVAEARSDLEAQLDDLESAARSAVDLPAKLRRDPVRTAGLAGGAVFLLAGGPRRLARGIMRRVRGERPTPAPRSLLPEEIERAVEGLGEDAEGVKATLEREFAAYLAEKRQDRETAPQAARSFWKLFDTLSGPLGSRAARRLAEQLFAARPDRPAAPSESPEEPLPPAGPAS
jgi:hypothetical protein